MKVRTKLGMVIRKSSKQRKATKKKKLENVSLRHIFGAAKASMSPGADAVGSALRDAREAVLSATGALAGGVAGIAKAVNDANAAKRGIE